MAGSSAARKSDYYNSAENSYNNYLNTGSVRGGRQAIRAGSVYSHGSTAEALPSYQPQRKPAPKPQPRPRKKVKTVIEVQKDVQIKHRHYALAYMIVIAVAACAFLSLFMYAQGVEKRVQINQKTAQLEQLQTANSSLQASIYDGYDLNEVARIAEIQLGMSKPEEHQIAYVEIEKENYFVPYDDSVEVAEEQDSGFFSSLWSMVSGK